MCKANNYPPNLIDPNFDFDKFTLDYLNKNIIIFLNRDNRNNIDMSDEQQKFFYYYGVKINECGIYSYFFDVIQLVI